MPINIPYKYWNYCYESVTTLFASSVAKCDGKRKRFEGQFDNGPLDITTRCFSLLPTQPVSSVSYSSAPESSGR